MKGSALIYTYLNRTRLNTVWYQLGTGVFADAMFLGKPLWNLAALSADTV